MSFALADVIVLPRPPGWVDAYNASCLPLPPHASGKSLGRDALIDLRAERVSASRATSQRNLLSACPRRAMGSSAPNSRRHWPRHRGSYKPCPATLRRSVQCRLKGFLNTGGTSGPLFGMWFHEIAKAASTEPVEVSSLAAGVSNGLAPSSVSAKQGYNTMVDAIAPAADALTNAAAQQSNLGEALEAAAHAARVGAESTRSLIASRGRASYVGEVARGVLGPGAVSVALFFASAVVTNGGQEPDNSWLSGWRRLSAWKALAVLIDATAK